MTLPSSTLRILTFAGGLALLSIGIVVIIQSEGGAKKNAVAQIDLEIAPETVEFEGFVNYGSPITATVTEPQPNDVPTIVHIHD